jgi:polysaccharide export outer membrane protein
LVKVTLPEYRIEPPDILLLDAVRVVPLPPYKIEPLDSIIVQVSNAFKDQPISGLYMVESDGTVNLEYSYGSVQVASMTIAEARAAIEKHLAGIINKPQVVVAQGQSRALQQIRGEHLVRPDGTVGLGIYSSVRVAGMTISEAKAAIEQHLSQYLYKPEVALDVFAYNSKVYYVIFDGGGLGQQVIRLPITGNDTVLDAISQVYGLTAVSNKNRVWLSRPSPACSACDQVLAVDWTGITTRGRTETNYQLLPGDRLYIDSDCWVTFDTRLARVLNPIERVFGFTLLGNGTIFSVANDAGGGKYSKGGGGSGGGGGGF